ncbi:MAG: dTDP-4-dehydrorhamnose 3,5-epimerase [Candidatus Burarchaeum sp.]|nr:dTDP-4-dehydrorhamnose 3,5-epimerase [Candidatus Burarchaeum sp.]MDO8339828.1 dTDP-4-dehydrorhamnose 3,5-epimerase [Candidatus Burarchaeum sp.]
MRLKISELPLKGARLLEAFEAEDARGRFSKFFEDALFKELNFTVHEVFASMNKKNVVRGLHFQDPQPQARIVWCPQGRIYDVLVDIRKNSPTFKKWHGVELSGKNKLGIYIPHGFAHGFLSLEKDSYVLYLADAPWSPESEKGIKYDDPALGISWPGLTGKPIQSERDAKFGNFREEDAY